MVEKQNKRYFNGNFTFFLIAASYRGLGSRSRACVVSASFCTLKDQIEPIKTCAVMVLYYYFALFS